MRKSAYLLFPLLLFGLWFVFPSFPQAIVVRYVSNTSPTCNGQTPCYPTIQAAVTVAHPGNIVRIQAGQYNEAMVVQNKNQAATATEAGRIFIEADSTAPSGSVIIGTANATCTAGTIF